MTNFIRVDIQNLTSKMRGRRVSNFWIASLTKISTSAAAISLVSDKNSIKTGITVAATSGNCEHTSC